MPRRICSIPASTAPAAVHAKPSRKTPAARHNKRSCSRENTCGFDRMPRGARVVAAQEFEHGSVILPIDARVGMREASDPRLSGASEGNGALDVTQRPQCKREVQHRRDAGILSEAERQIVVPGRLEQRERALQMIARLRVLLRRTSVSR